MQSKQIDFTGKTIYVGIDVHQHSWKVAILCDGQLLKRFSQPADVPTLINHLTKHYPGATFECGYEAGFCGYWICRHLNSIPGMSCKVLHAADIPTTDKERRYKTDARDCAKIAACLANNMQEGIYIPSEQMQHACNLVRTRAKISKDCTRVRNRIKAIIQLMNWPLEIPDYWSNRYLEQIRVWAEEHGELSLKLQLKEYKLLRQLKAECLNAVRELSKSEPYSADYALLRKIPGISLVTGMTFLVEVGDIRRFKGLDQLASMVGLIPNTNASGEKAGIGRITKRGKSQLKNVLIEAAWVATNHDQQLKAAYQKYKQRMNGNRAIIRIAKKLLNRMRTVLIHRVEYQKDYQRP